MHLQLGTALHLAPSALNVQHVTKSDATCLLLSASSVWRKLSTDLSSPQVENGEGLDKEETKVEEP